MDWNVLIEAIISLISVPIWAISFRIAWPSIKDMLKGLPKKDKCKHLDKDEHLENDEK